MANRPITDYPDAPDIESSTRDYASRFDREVGAWFLRCQKEATQKSIRGSNLGVLDVGGGHGQNIESITELGHSLTILGSHDSSTEMIQEAIDSNRISYQCGSLLKLPYEDNSFDVVISYRTLSHMDQWNSFVDELCRVAKDMVIIDYPSKYSFNILYDSLFFLKKRLEENTREFNFYTAASIAKSFEKNNFEPDTLYKQYFLPMAVHRLISAQKLSAAIAGLFRITGLTGLFGSPVIASFKSR